MEVTTATFFRGCQDYGFGNLDTHWHMENDKESLDSKALVICSPDNALLLQALTPASAVDSVEQP